MRKYQTQKNRKFPPPGHPENICWSKATDAPALGPCLPQDVSSKEHFLQSLDCLEPHQQGKAAEQRAKQSFRGFMSSYPLFAWSRRPLLRPGLISAHQHFYPHQQLQPEARDKRLAPSRHLRRGNYKPL